MAMKNRNPGGGCRIFRLFFGRCNVYLLDNGSHRILVDTGARIDRGRILNTLEAIGRPDAVIMTHTHFDHTGNAGALNNRFAPGFIVHESEREYLESGESPLPGGTGRISNALISLGRKKAGHWFRVAGAPVSRTVTDHLDLAEWGFDAYILHTPGHSCGSCSVIVENRVAVVGDAMVGYPRFIYPPFADEPGDLLKSWGKLLSTGCSMFLPAHGFPVDRKELECSLARRMKR